MFTLNGKLINVFETPAGKDKQGKEYPATHKAQISGEVTLKNGDKRFELLTLTIPPGSLSAFIAQIGCDVSLPCGIFASGGKITPFLTA